jgi:hypothetical protein
MEAMAAPIHPGRRLIFLFLPCGAVFIGLHLLESAWAAILLYHTVIVACLFLAMRDRPGRGLFSGWSTPIAAALTLLCASCGPLLVIMWPLIDNTPHGFSPTLVALGLKGTGWYLFVALLVSFHPLLEELFWRDALDSGSAWIDIADIAFAAYHVIVLTSFLKIPWVIFVTFVLVMISWVWRRTAKRTGGLIVPLISHVAAGFGIMAAAFILSMR